MFHGKTLIEFGLFYEKLLTLWNQGTIEMNQSPFGRI